MKKPSALRDPVYIDISAEQAENFEKETKALSSKWLKNTLMSALFNFTLNWEHPSEDQFSHVIYNHIFRFAAEKEIREVTSKVPDKIKFAGVAI